MLVICTATEAPHFFMWYAASSMIKKYQQTHMLACKVVSIHPYDINDKYVSIHLSVSVKTVFWSSLNFLRVTQSNTDRKDI